jgi:hypothetical protein
MPGYKCTNDVVLMSACTYFRIVIDTLFAQDAFHYKCEESQVSKANNSYKVRLVNIENIRQFTLDRRDDTTT